MDSGTAAAKTKADPMPDSLSVECELAVRLQLHNHHHQFPADHVGSSWLTVLRFGILIANSSQFPFYINLHNCLVACLSSFKNDLFGHVTYFPNPIEQFERIIFLLSRAHQCSNEVVKHSTYVLTSRWLSHPKRQQGGHMNS